MWHDGIYLSENTFCTKCIYYCRIYRFFQQLRISRWLCILGNSFWASSEILEQKGGNAQNGTQNDIISKKPAAEVEAASAAHRKWEERLGPQIFAINQTPLNYYPFY